ncbi:hypothetical protein LIA77_05641 [Sarocladium implicatum]|nr:hypothetical protein LIA77_05641 [Sarocladium implicatum]
MIAAHRDQENLVHSHQVPTKHNPKTPGARYPKTPSRFNDENASTAFAAKGAVTGTKIGGMERTGGKGAGGRQALMTPIGNQNRAVLGNKTTNAKARGGQTGGVKGIVKELEKTAAKPTTTQRPKHRAPEVAPIKFDVRQDKVESDNDDEEPEYAPPPVKDQPYESDVLPLGLSMDGLKNENLLKGFYDYYHNPVDENGVSRKDKQLEDEMEQLLERAAARNERDLRDLDWTVRRDDVAPTKPTVVKTSVPKPNAMPKSVHRDPGTINSRRAAAALSQPSQTRPKPTVKPAITVKAPTRRPLSSLLQSSNTVKRTIAAAQNPTTGSSRAMASRATLGYNQGRSASSLVRNAKTGSNKAPKDADAVSTSSNETITPARARNAMRCAAAPASPPKPQFLSIFHSLDEDEDLPMPVMPQSLLEEDEEEFELRLDL